MIIGIIYKIYYYFSFWIKQRMYWFYNDVSFFVSKRLKPLFSRINAQIFNFEEVSSRKLYLVSTLEGQKQTLKYFLIINKNPSDPKHFWNITIVIEKPLLYLVIS